MDISSLFKSQALLECFCRLVEALDGAVINPDDRTPGLAGDPDWVDMADLYLAACVHLGRDPVVRGEDGEPWTGVYNGRRARCLDKHYSAWWVEAHNGGSGLTVLESAHPIEADSAAARLKAEDGLDWDRDSISLVDGVTLLDMDEAVTEEDEEE